MQFRKKTLKNLEGTLHVGGNPLFSRTAFCLLVLSSGATSSAPWKEKCWDKGAAGLYSHVMGWGNLIHCREFVCELITGGCNHRRLLGSIGSFRSPASPSSKSRTSLSQAHHPLNTASSLLFPAVFASPIPLLLEDEDPHVSNLCCCHASLRSGSHLHPLGLLDETTTRRTLFTLDLNCPAKQTPPHAMIKKSSYFSFLWVWLPSGLVEKHEPGDRGSQSSLSAWRVSRDSSGSPISTCRTPVRGTAHQLSPAACAQQRWYQTAAHICEFLLPMYFWMKNTLQKTISQGNVCRNRHKGKEND